MNTTVSQQRRKMTITKIYGLRIYTKTKMDGRTPKMYGVIEGAVNKMMKAYPEEFSFMRHETKRKKWMKENT